MVTVQRGHIVSERFLEGGAEASIPLSIKRK